jgi:hypothetical protein
MQLGYRLVYPPDIPNIRQSVTGIREEMCIEF